MKKPPANSAPKTPTSGKTGPLPAKNSAQNHAPSTASASMLPRLFVTLFLYVYAAGNIIPSLPALVKEFAQNDTSNASFYTGALVASQAFLEFLFNPVLGQLSDRYGRKLFLLMGIAGAMFDSLLFAVSPSFVVIIIGHALSGITGVIFSISYAMVADISNSQNLSKNYGVMGVAFGAGFILGPGTGGLIGQWNVRYPFAVAAGVCMLNLVYTAIVVPETNVAADQRGRPFKLKEANPLHTLHILRTLPVLKYLALVLFLSGMAAGVFSIWVLYTGHRLGWDLIQNGIFLAVFGIFAVFSQGVVMRLVINYFGDWTALMLGLVANIFQWLILAFQPFFWWPFLALPVAIFAFFIGPVLRAIMAKCVPPNEVGALQGAVGSLSTLTRVVGPVVASQSFGFAVSLTTMPLLAGFPFFISACISVIALFVTVYVHKAKSFRSFLDEHMSASLHGRRFSLGDSSMSEIKIDKRNPYNKMPEPAPKSTQSQKRAPAPTSAAAKPAVRAQQYNAAKPAVRAPQQAPYPGKPAPVTKTAQPPPTKNQQVATNAKPSSRK